MTAERRVSSGSGQTAIGRCGIRNFQLLTRKPSAKLYFVLDYFHHQKNEVLSKSTSSTKSKCSEAESATSYSIDGIDVECFPYRTSLQRVGESEADEVHRIQRCNHSAGLILLRDYLSDRGSAACVSLRQPDAPALIPDVAGVAQHSKPSTCLYLVSFSMRENLPTLLDFCCGMQSTDCLGPHETRSKWPWSNNCARCRRFCP